MTSMNNGGYGTPYGGEPDAPSDGTQGAPYQNPTYQNPSFQNSAYQNSTYQNPQYTNPAPQQPYAAPQQPYAAPQQPYATPQQQYYNAQAPAPYAGYGAVMAPPSLAATVLVTVFFGLFGLIPAAIHSQRANQMGQDGNRYWKAFGITMGIEIAVTVLLYVFIYIVAAASIVASS